MGGGSMNKPLAIDLFCGLGGWTEGLVGERMFTRKHAVRRNTVTTLPREIVSRFVSRALERAAQAERNAEWKARDELKKEIEERVRKDVERKDTEELQSLRGDAARYQEIAKLIGIKRHDWEPHERTLRLLRMLRAIDADKRIVASLEYLLASIADSTAGVRDLVTELQKELAPPSQVGGE